MRASPKAKCESASSTLILLANYGFRFRCVFERGPFATSLLNNEALSKVAETFFKKMHRETTQSSVSVKREGVGKNVAAKGLGHVERGRQSVSRDFPDTTKAPIVVPAVRTVLAADGYTQAGAKSEDVNYKGLALGWKKKWLRVDHAEAAVARHRAV